MSSTDSKPEISGVLVMDKPAGLTSHDVVARVRKILNQRQVGHFGTLDPFATGVLPVSVGKATRFAQFYLKSRKSYEGAIHFGFSTDTYDATGEATSEAVVVAPEAALLEDSFRQFTGRLLQAPPPFSAKHIGGVRAYELARQRKPVTLAPVEVEIYALELLSLEGAKVRFAVECSGGTYVRSLAHDLGQKLGCGAHLAALRRTAVAEFVLSRAVTLERLQGRWNPVSSGWRLCFPTVRNWWCVAEKKFRCGTAMRLNLLNPSGPGAVVHRVLRPPRTSSKSSARSAASSP
jgi:tRNA pseudouridine55 synthase